MKMKTVYVVRPLMTRMTVFASTNIRYERMSKSSNSRSRSQHRNAALTRHVRSATDVVKGLSQCLIRTDLLSLQIKVPFESIIPNK